jgi:cytolysin-activating lysine-acyltransferase
MAKSIPKKSSKKSSKKSAKKPSKKPTPLAAKNGALHAQPKAAATLPLTKVPQPDADTLKKLGPHLAKVRAHVRESFGKIVMSIMLLPRYRSLAVAELQSIVLEPLTRDRIALAYPGKGENNNLSDLMGAAIWAAVSEEADARIRAQIKANRFPVRLKPEDWNSGKIIWILDVIAGDQKTASLVISNFDKVVKGGTLRLHPLISKMVDVELLKKFRAKMSSSAKPQT